MNVREARGVAESVDRGPEIAAVAAGWSAGLGMPVTAILLGWENHGPWIAPDYFPPYGGDAAFKTLVDDLHRAGNHAMLFLSGLNVTLEKTARNGAPAYKIPQADAARLRPSAVVDPGGQVRVEGSAAAEGIGAHLVLCPATDAARAALDDAFDRPAPWGPTSSRSIRFRAAARPPASRPGTGTRRAAGRRPTRRSPRFSTASDGGAAARRRVPRSRWRSRGSCSSRTSICSTAASTCRDSGRATGAASSACRCSPLPRVRARLRRRQRADRHHPADRRRRSTRMKALWPAGGSSAAVWMRMIPFARCGRSSAIS
jgi:hypothetical protein